MVGAQRVRAGHLAVFQLGEEPVETIHTPAVALPGGGFQNHVGIECFSSLQCPPCPVSQILDVPAGPALAQLAAELPNERWPVLLEGGQGSGSLNRWRFLAWDPLEVVEHRVTGLRESDPTARGAAATGRRAEPCFRFSLAG